MHKDSCGAGGTGERREATFAGYVKKHTKHTGIGWYWYL